MRRSRGPLRGASEWKRLLPGAWIQPFHRPQDLADEVRRAGLAVEGVFVLEGPAWILPDVSERMANPERRAALLRMARLLEAETSVMGTSAHLLAVARRPT